MMNWSTRGRIRTVNPELEAEVRRIQEKGELRHLYGQPLDLSDDCPDWLAYRALKRSGFSHPVLEWKAELDARREQIDQTLDRLRSHYLWLHDHERERTDDRVANYHRLRSQTFERYRAKLVELNRDIRDYNLSVPQLLHIRHIPMAEALERAEQSIPPLDPRPRRPGLWERLRRLLRRLGHPNRAADR